MFYCTSMSHTMLMNLSKKMGGRRKMVKKIMKLLGMSYKDAVALTKGVRRG